MAESVRLLLQAARLSLIESNPFVESMNNSRGVTVRPNNIKQINGDFLSDCLTVGTMADSYNEGPPFMRGFSPPPT